MHLSGHLKDSLVLNIPCVLPAQNIYAFGMIFKKVAIFYVTELTFIYVKGLKCFYFVSLRLSFAHAVIGSEWELTLSNLMLNNHFITDDTNIGTSGTQTSEIETNVVE